MVLGGGGSPVAKHMYTCTRKYLGLENFTKVFLCGECGIYEDLKKHVYMYICIYVGFFDS